jgi:hypothetical protein
VRSAARAPARFQLPIRFEIVALRKLRDDGKVGGRVIETILDDNPRAFYGL